MGNEKIPVNGKIPLDGHYERNCLRVKNSGFMKECPFIYLFVVLCSLKIAYPFQGKINSI